MVSHQNQPAIASPHVPNVMQFLNDITPEPA